VPSALLERCQPRVPNGKPEPAALVCRLRKCHVGHGAQLHAKNLVAYGGVVVRYRADENLAVWPHRASRNRDRCGGDLARRNTRKRAGAGRGVSGSRAQRGDARTIPGRVVDRARSGRRHDGPQERRGGGNAHGNSASRVVEPDAAAVDRRMRRHPRNSAVVAHRAAGGQSNRRAPLRQHDGDPRDLRGSDRPRNRGVVEGLPRPARRLDVQGTVLRDRHSADRLSSRGPGHQTNTT
jgi:hypothetical protein